MQTSTKTISLLGKAYTISFGGYAVIFALMNHIGDLATSLCTSALFLFQLSYIIVLRKCDKMSIGEAFMKGIFSSVCALATVILEMYIGFFVCGMSTTNALTGEMSLVNGVDIFRVSGADKLMNVFFVSLFLLCVAFAAAYTHINHKRSQS